MATKLRASCNGCHFAKIKCIKTEQGCQRCCASGEQCSYSPALPRVYHKKRTRKIPSTASTSVDESNGKLPRSPNTATSSVTQPKLLNANDPVEASNGDTSAKMTIQDFNLTSNGPNGFCWPYGLDGSLMENFESASDPLEIDLWGHAGTPLGLSNTMSTSSPVNTTSSGASMQHLLDSSPKQIRRGEGPDLATSELPAVLDSQMTANYQSCKCSAGLLSAMQRISEHADTSDPPLDRVLCANRAAAKNCITTLHCAYGASTENVSCNAVACGLLGHILASYQAALDSFCADLERDRTENPGADEGDEGGLVPSGGLQVRLGAFAVEKGEQVLCTKEIVAREIEKLRLALEGCIREGENIRKVLLAHLIQRCANLVDEITG